MNVRFFLISASLNPPFSFFLHPKLLLQRIHPPKILLGVQASRQIRHPVPLRTSAQDEVQFILQSSQRHIQQEEQSRRKEIDKAEPEARPMRVSEMHQMPLPIS